MHADKSKLAEHSRNPEDFYHKYNDLKVKNIRELDPLVHFLAEISDKPEVKFLFFKI